MPYYISYNGKILGKPMEKEQAEVKLNILSRCFENLSIVNIDEDQESQEAEHIEDPNL